MLCSSQQQLLKLELLYVHLLKAFKDIQSAEKDFRIKDLITFDLCFGRNATYIFGPAQIQRQTWDVPMCVNSVSAAHPLLWPEFRFTRVPVLLCAQVSTSRPGGENPSYCPECVQHGHQGGADTAKQRGTRKRYSRKHHLHPCHWCTICDYIRHNKYR